MLTCGIVILNYMDCDTTEGLLSLIKDCPEIDHIAVVDNASPNDSYTRLKKYESDKISVIQSGRNGGYSFGNNFGARYLIEKFHPDIIGIANPDTIFDGKFVCKIKEAFETAPDYSLLTGVQMLPDGEINYHPFWDESTALINIEILLFGLAVHPMKPLLAKLFNAAKLGRKYEEYRDKILRSPQRINEVWAVMGCCLFIRAKDFEEIGMYDENVFMYVEENILAKRLQNSGKKTGIINDITFIHDHKFPANKLDRIKSGSVISKRFYVSLRYYFNNYLTDSKILQVFFAALVRVLETKLKILRTIRSFTALIKSLHSR